MMFRARALLTALLTSTTVKSETTCESSIPTTPCGAGCILSDRIDKGVLQCLNDTCVLADPLSTKAQLLLDNGVATIDTFLEGCYEKNDAVPGVNLVGGLPTLLGLLVLLSLGWY